MDHGWAGQHQRPYEHAGALSIVQMGARPYSPLLGRFLSVDPVDGGSANDYDFAEPDAVNNEDLDGRSSRRVLGKSNMNWYERIRCMWLPRRCAVYAAISFWAGKTAAAWFRGRWERGENAFRHCIWQAMLVVTLGYWNACAWGYRARRERPDTGPRYGPVQQQLGTRRRPRRGAVWTSGIVGHSGW